MNFKKIIASVAAAAVAVSAMAVSAFAANFTCTDPYAPDAYLRLVNEPAKEETEGIGVFTQAGLDPTTVYGFKITLVGDVNQGAGGGCGFNSQSTGWKSMEWGNEAAGKELSVAADNTITYLSDKPVFAATDTYCHIWIQSWWGNVDVEVTAIQPLDKDGNAIDYASLIAAKAAAAEEAAPADEDAAATDDADEAAADDVDEAAAADDADDIATDDADDVATDDADDVDVDADEADDADDVATDDADDADVAADDADDVATDDADDADAAADEADVADTTADAPAADADTTASSTGNTSAAVILSVMAVAGVAAIVAKKRK